MLTMVMFNQPVRIEWRTPVSDGELIELTQSHGGEPEVGGIAYEDTRWGG